MTRVVAIAIAMVGIMASGCVAYPPNWHGPIHYDNLLARSNDNNLEGQNNLIDAENEPAYEEYRLLQRENPELDNQGT